MKPKLCFITDYRSAISRNWIRHFVETGHEVHVIATYPVETRGADVPVYVVPLALARWRGSGGTAPGTAAATAKSWKTTLRQAGQRHLALARVVRDWLAPLDLYPQARQIRALIDDIQPDLVHAMRIPFEGIAAAVANPDVPLIISIWGNDFTLHARSSLPVSLLSRRAMRRVDGLHSDCERDLRLAPRWGFDLRKPHINLPGAGGIQAAIFHPADGSTPPAPLDQVDIPAGAPVVINPRGPSAYVRNDIFFQAAAQVLRQRPETVFLCSVMQGNAVMEGWVQKLGLGGSVHLLPRVPHTQMAELFRRADVTVSLATHDGTPNTLLEAMACGCFPVVGDIETIHEWIEHERNGLICSPRDASAAANAILRALADSDLRASARAINQTLIAERADYPVVMARAEAFYQEVLATAHRG